MTKIISKLLFIRKQMSEDIHTKDPKEMASKPEIKDFLSNERTFLAWIRTCIGIMAFGFIIERFSLFTAQMSHLNGAVVKKSPFLGISLILFGGIVAALSYVRYKSVEREIKANKYNSVHMLGIILTIAVIVIGAILIVYTQDN